MADLNPFDAPLKQAKATIKEISNRKSGVVEELNWFDSNDESKLGERLKVCRSKSEKLRAKIEDLGIQISNCEEDTRQTQPIKRTVLNPKNWFASDQIEVRRKLKGLRNTQISLEAERQTTATQITESDNAVKAAEAELRRFVEFDRDGRAESLEAIEQELRSAQSSAMRIAERKRSVDAALEPLVTQMREQLSRKKQLESTLSRAESLDWQITNADNSYERAMVHEQCEREFSVGSPGKVAGKARSEIRRITRDYEKAYKRAAEIGMKAARRIDELIIDGNNLCYDDNGFIGLVGLEALIPILQPSFDVTIVFDAAIRRMAKVNDKRLSEILGDGIRVHVVATSGKADETVIDLAGNNKYCYIVSNDRFGDFNEKLAVKQNRIIRHEIVNGRLMIHDLGVNVEYASTLANTQRRTRRG